MEDKDKLFMDMAYMFADKPTCKRRKVGAVIERNSRPISSGYNGAPSGLEHCAKETCLRTVNNIPSGERQEMCIGAHAEQNAITYAAANGIAIKDTTLYCTTYPCASCAKSIVGAEITKVVYKEGYPDPLTEIILQNVEVVKYE